MERRKCFLSEKVFCKSTCWYSENKLRSVLGVLKSTGEVLSAKTQGDDLSKLLGVVL